MQANLEPERFLAAALIATEQIKRERKARRLSTASVFVPNPGGQSTVVDLARGTDVDEILYVGQPGGGKTYLCLGLAATMFKTSRFYRREFAQLSGTDGAMVKAREMFGPLGRDIARENRSDHTWSIRNDEDVHILQFAHCKDGNDIYNQQGNGAALLAIDEGTNWPWHFISFLRGWNRSNTPGTRTLTVITGNWPTTLNGRWIEIRYAAWFDPRYPNPAMPGEVRYFVSNKAGAQIECPSRAPVVIDGKERHPEGRTWVPSYMDENPAFSDGEYRRRIDAMEEPFRSILMQTRHSIAIEDDAFQVVPGLLVKAAQDRARKMSSREYGEVDQWGCDVAHGGADKTCIVGRTGSIVHEPILMHGEETDDGWKVASRLEELVVEHGGWVAIDANTWGASAYDILTRSSIASRVMPVIAGGKTKLHDKSGLLKFKNIRALLWWNFRTWLKDHAETAVLPIHPHVFDDLTCARFQLENGTIEILPKEEQIEKIGRSPDVGEAILHSVLPLDIGTTTSLWALADLGGDDGEE